MRDNKGFKARCLWATLALLIIVFSAMSYGLFAQAASDIETYIMEQEIPCGFCHVAQLDEWEMSAHANAFNDPVFQASWVAQGEPSACLDCHTSIGLGREEYNASLGVTCEMCHGSALEMTEPVTPEDCGACHSYTHYPTYDEWMESKHSSEGIGCMDCHDLPSLTLRTEDPNQLCFECHPDTTEAWEQGDHATPDSGCVDCHMMRFMSPMERVAHDETGHSLLPGIPDEACESCHDEPIEGHMEWQVGPQGCYTCHHETYMTKLHLGDGSVIPINESSLLCSQCHEKVYEEWEEGLHGSVHEAKGCVDCHIIWSPYFTWNETLPRVPFTSPNTANEVLTSLLTSPPLPVYMFLGSLVVIFGAVFVTRRSGNG